MFKRIAFLRSEILMSLGLLCIFFSSGVPSVVAGALPLPLEAQLDLAERVVVGKIVGIKDSEPKSGETARYGRATLEVAETLKGGPAETVEFNVATWVSKDYGGCAPLRVRKEGDSGIWLIYDGGSYYEMLSGDRKDEVQKIVKMLAERNWSEPVNGLCAWAGLVNPGEYGAPDARVIVFAVRNASDKDIFVPVELNHGFVTATLTGKNGKTIEKKLSERQSSDKVFCRKLSPGKIAYLHPLYSNIYLGRPEYKIPEGEYSVVIGCRNDLEGEGVGEDRFPVKVSAWKGELKAAPLDIAIKQ